MQNLILPTNVQFDHLPDYPRTCKGNPCLPHCWQGVPLTYTLHALARCAERGLPLLATLPSDARLADTDTLPDGTATVTFKISAEISDAQNGGFFVVLSREGCVITCYVRDANYERAHRLKQRRRRRSLLYQA